MSLALASLRRHFVEHLTSGNSATGFSSFRRLSSSTACRKRMSRLSTAVVNCSTLPLNGGARTACDSLTSPYLCVRISCPRHVAGMLSESLLCFGASSTTIDEQDSHNSEEEIWISSTFDIEKDVKDCVSRAADSVGLEELPNYEVETHDHANWIKQSQESFHPVEITQGLWIVPEWRSPPDPQAINIVLNPGLAFGTGEHPTTQLCLLMLHRLIRGGEYFLDYGTGSGVLAIAALKFGVELSVGFDIEPQAIASARHNAALNNIRLDKLLLRLVSANGEFPHENIDAPNSYNTKLISEKDNYDVVIANILLHPLLDLADRIVSYAKPGAVIGLSGIISEQVPTVVEHYSRFLEGINVSMIDDWACISGFKKAEQSIG